ncbi:unnamed protein product, partial [Darwinula stevensoni]
MPEYKPVKCASESAINHTMDPPDRVLPRPNGGSCTFYSRQLRQYSSLPSHYRARDERKKPLSNIEFRCDLNMIKSWFANFNESQKRTTLLELYDMCNGSVWCHHGLSLRLEYEGGMHGRCYPGCMDFVTWFPLHLSLRILSYLDPKSLATCARVSRPWKEVSYHDILWQKLCQLPQWRLSEAGERKHRELHRKHNGRIDWRMAFVERYRLKRNWARGQCHVRTFEGHTQAISCVQFDEDRIVSGSHDKTIKVWNMRTNSQWSVMTLVGHSGTVRCLHLSGNRLVSGSSDCSIKVWDLEIKPLWSSIACKVTMLGHTDTVRCLQADEKKVVSGSYDMTIKVWDLKGGECLKTLHGHEGPVLCMQFDQRHLITGGGDSLIKVWDLDMGECMMTLEGHQNAVTCLNFDGERIVSGSLDHTIKMWHRDGGTCLATLDWRTSEGHTGVIRSLQADSWRIVSASDDKTLKVWDWATGQRLLTLRRHTDGVTCVQFNDFIIVSGSYDKTVKLWDF